MTRIEYELVVSLNGERLTAVGLRPEGATIGREATNALVLTDSRVSSRHAHVAIRGATIVVTDLSSSTGTFHRGRRIEAATVAPGEEFQIGPYALSVLPRGTPADGPGPVAASELRQFLDDLVGLTEALGVTDLEAVLETILERTMQLLSCERGFLVLTETEGLSPILARRGPIPASRHPYSRTVCQRALAGRKPVLLDTVADLDRIEAIESLADSGSRTVLAVPLMQEGEALGVLYLESSDRLAPRLARLDALLGRVASVGGQVLRAALDRHQIVADRDRWRWLASTRDDEPDILRSCSSPSMRSVQHFVQRVAAEDVTVLLVGETGTGKEVTARTIHRMSPRRNGPFVTVNCAAIPKDLLEAELFGHEKGAFSGAIRQRLGRFELAQGGTLLLDEVGELAGEAQAKLLRVLETRTCERVGGAETIVLDARLIAATNQDLTRMVAAGTFREDLFYRLNVVTISLPPLRERPDDLESLVTEILRLTNRRFRRKLCGVTPEAFAALRAYRWPGNARELKNVIERAFVLETGDLITPASLPFPGDAGPAARTLPATATPATEPPVIPLSRFLVEQEKAYIQLVLDRMGGNISRTAEALGVGRTGLHRRIRQLGIKPSAFRSQ